MWPTDDYEWLEQNYPGLHITSESEISGRLTFQVMIDGDLCYINPSAAQICDTNSTLASYICDTYLVRLSWEEGSWPSAFETGGKLAETAECLGKTLLDMHQLKTNELCLASPIEIIRAIQKGLTLKTYIEDFLIPYLAAQTHYKESGIWIFGELSHGLLGIFEWLGRQPMLSKSDVASTLIYLQHSSVGTETNEILKKRPRGHNLCMCGSRKKMRECHPEVLRGIIILRSALATNLRNSLIRS